MIALVVLLVALTLLVVSTWNDVTRRGDRVPSAAERAKVKAFLLDHVGARRAFSEKQAIAATGVNGRTIRAARELLEIAHEVCTGSSDDGEGMFQAEYQEEVDRKNARERQHAYTTLRVCDERDVSKQSLPRRQNFLF